MSLAMTNKPEHSFDWEELLLFIEERRVIPIVGKELLVVPSDDGEVSWEHHLSSRLASALGIDPSTLPSNYDLNDVALLYVRNGGRRPKIYSKIKALVEEKPVPIPEALKKIAAIRHFNLFINTSFSPLLVDAINEVRFQGEKKTQCLAYSNHSMTEDLPSEIRNLKQPCVYQLFGPLTSSAEYAVTEEDTLELLYSLQSENRPKILFDELRKNHLLFLGCSFPDWLERFFVRTITNVRLLNSRETSQLIADTCTQNDHRLALFLRHYQAEIFSSGDAAKFVDELYCLWSERNPTLGTGINILPVDCQKMEPGAIFLSYARQDQEAVRALKDALENAGLDVWFDEGKLQPGAAWDREIKNNIRRCSLFLPLISRNAQKRVEGYFRREWNWALDRAEGMDDDFPFIQPVLIDDLPEGAPGIPEGFWNRHCTRFPGGRPSADFVRRTKETIRGLRLVEAGRL